MPSEPTSTLVQDLEAAADVLRLREANDIQPPLDSTLGKRLRASAARLREAIEKSPRWEWRDGMMRGGIVREWLEMVNAGPLPATPSETPNPCPNHVSRKPGCAMCAHGSGPVCAAPTSGACETWCSSGTPPPPLSTVVTRIYGAWGHYFCTPACRDAGRPINPRKETP